MIKLAKKFHLWNHFVAQAYETNGFPKGVTGKKLAKIKSIVLQSKEIWEDLEMHGMADGHPDALMLRDRVTYDHMTGNFWGMIVMYIEGIN